MQKFVRRGREFWTKVVGEFERADGAESHAAFAERRGIGMGSFQRWLYRLRAEAPGPRWGTQRRKKGRATAPVPWPLVEVQASRVMDGRFEIELAGGRHLHVPEAFDAEALRRLLAIIEEKPSA